MSQLTREECDIISQSPLADTLSTVRHALREAEQKTSTESSQSDDRIAGVPERPRLFVAAMGKLFSLLILSASDVSLCLASRTGRDSLASDLLVVRSRLLKGDFEYKHFRQLSQLVSTEAPDVDIWAAVISVLRAISQSTPPPSLPPSFDTPITHSSASQQGSEQTRKKLEPRVFEEIRYCTHRGVQNFHEKYFEGQEMGQASQTSLASGQRSLQRQREEVDGYIRHTDREDEMCAWWMELQKELLADERAAYFQSTAKRKVGLEARRQLDLFVKSRKNGAVEAEHHWEHVLVVESSNTVG